MSQLEIGAVIAMFSTATIVLSMVVFLVVLFPMAAFLTAAFRAAFFMIVLFMVVFREIECVDGVDCRFDRRKVVL